MTARAARALVLGVALHGVVAACTTGVARDARDEGGVARYAIDGDGIAAPLGGRVGDAARGRALVVARGAANCVLCHAIPDAAFPLAGDVGPSLAGVGDRLSAAQLRLRVVDMRTIAPRTPMPSYHRIEGLADVAPAFRGRPLLAAHEIEDIVAYLTTLR